MQVSRLVGWAVGMAILACGFFLPFWNLTTGPQSFDTLYGAGRFVVYDAGSILSSSATAAVTLAAVVLLAVVLVGISGVFGVYPRASGALGVFGMLLLTLGPLLVVPDFAFATTNYGTGYWAIWVLSVINVFVGVAMGGRKAQPLPPPLQAQAPIQPPAPTPAPAS